MLTNILHGQAWVSIDGGYRRPKPGGLPRITGAYSGTSEAGGDVRGTWPHHVPPTVSLHSEDSTLREWAS